MVSTFWLNSGEDVREESKSDNYTNKEEFFEKKKDDSKKKGDAADGGIELASTSLVGTGG